VATSKCGKAISVRINFTANVLGSSSETLFFGDYLSARMSKTAEEFRHCTW
jgi:hypothetical protein